MDINYESLADLHTQLNLSFQNALIAEPPSQWTQIATRIGSSSGQNDYPWLEDDLEDMREWFGPRIARELKSARYSITNRHFELTLKAQRTQIEDDAGGLVSVYGSRAAIMARRVRRHPDILMFGEVIARAHERLGYDGQPFFDGSHPVGDSGDTASNDMGGSGTPWYLLDLSAPVRPFIFQVRKEPEFQALVNLTDPNVFFNKEFIWGADARYNGGYGLWQHAVKSKQTLNGTNFDLAWNRMSSFVNGEGVKFGVRPTALLYPTSLATQVRDLFEPEFLANGASNVYRATRASVGLQLIESPWLPDADPA